MLKYVETVYFLQAKSVMGNMKAVKGIMVQKPVMNFMLEIATNYRTTNETSKEIPAGVEE